MNAEPSHYYRAVEACAVRILAGAMLQADKVSAGNGRVIDWREVKSGKIELEGGDAFDIAHRFVELVGVQASMAAAEAHKPPPKPPLEVTAYCQAANGGRRRSFKIDRFTVLVEPHEDDEAQARFTAILAALASEMDI
ncbi:MAG TPA: hypothetical protein VMT47_11740 [Polyangia bacterium]|nr:hypothetical protein [Polyangia bacterium]